MNVNINEIAGSDVSSRQIAAAIRNQIVHSGKFCRIDFEGVRSVSSSFADELFGVLARDRGERWLSDHIRIKGASPEVRYTILDTVDSRLATG